MGGGKGGFLHGLLKPPGVYAVPTFKELEVARRRVLIVLQPGFPKSGSAVTTTQPDCVAGFTQPPMPPTFPLVRSPSLLIGALVHMMRCGLSGSKPAGRATASFSVVGWADAFAKLFSAAGESGCSTMVTLPSV